MVVNHLDKLFVTNDAATIIKELEVWIKIQLTLFVGFCGSGNGWLDISIELCINQYRVIVVSRMSSVSLRTRVRMYSKLLQRKTI